MTKNFSLYMLGIFLGLGSLVGFAFPFVLQAFIEIPPENLPLLWFSSLSAGWILGSANFLIFYYSSRYVIGQFRNVLARVRSEDYRARVEFSSNDMLGLLAEDVNATLSHLEEKNDEVLQDELTGLPNRQFLRQHYRRNFSRLATHRTAFLFFDLDKFKDINDQFGHLYGDQVLIEVSKRVSSALNENEFLVRLSGDEFLLVANLSEHCSGNNLAEQLQALFVEPLHIQNTFLPVQISIGVSTSPAHGIALGDLIRKADFAMYEAKKTEGSSYCLYEEGMEMARPEVAESC